MGLSVWRCHFFYKQIAPMGLVVCYCHLFYNQVAPIGLMFNIFKSSTILVYGTYIL